MGKVTKVTRMSVRAGSGLERRACKRFGLRTRRRRDILKCIPGKRSHFQCARNRDEVLHSSESYVWRRKRVALMWAI